jgi:2-amino-4-hydroxy-6-hydroxymethyldihydropteridine diphosphokinase
MNKVYLLIGGNMGDRMANLAQAIHLINQEIGPIQLTSSIYETAAWGNTNQSDFLNQALFLHTQLDASSLMNKLLEIEIEMGRKRAIPMGPRTIDLDIIYYNDMIISNELTCIPHPKITARRFVLMPLVEIAPQYIHPLLNKTNEALLKECGDSLAVYKKSDL